LYAKTILSSFLFLGSLASAAEKITYDDNIKEIFQNSCSSCHKPSKRKGGLNLMIYSDVLKGGASGNCVESGNTDSLLVKCVTHEEEPILKDQSFQIKKLTLFGNGSLVDFLKTVKVKVLKLHRITWL
jgi:mono/diheme cytochrome c family protein